MLSADDAEYPREYRTLGGGGGGAGGRRFSNVGLVHTSERRHTVIAAQSLEALSGLQKADADRKRDAFMDHLKSKYPQHALALRGQQDRVREQVSGAGVGGAERGGSGTPRAPRCSLGSCVQRPGGVVELFPRLGGKGWAWPADHTREGWLEGGGPGTEAQAHPACQGSPGVGKLREGP